MNAHTPFDAKKDWSNPYCQNSSNDPMVDALLGNAYHVVRTVYCNLGNLKLIYDFLNQYGMVLGVQSEAELKALTTKAKYARIYGFSRTGDRQVTDYLYVEGDRTGIIPDDPEATGSWVIVATSGSNGGGTSSGEGAYIPWVYSNGSATGGETTINVPDGTVGVPFIVINGDMQYVGRGFEFNVENLSVTLAQPLEEGDEVVILLTGTPAVPDNPNVNDWVQINWLYNNGAAVGGEQVIAIPYTFQSVPAVYKNGLRLVKNLATNSYLIDTDNQSIILTEPLTTNDRVIIQIGGEARVVEVSDRTVQEIARSLNVSDSDVILSTNTTSTLNGKKFLYSVEQQKVYELPILPSNIYISAVSGQTLTCNPGEIQVTLKEVITGKVLQSRIEAPDGAILYPELQIARWRDEGDIRGWGIAPGNPDNSSLINGAISELSSRGGGELLFRTPGVYLISEPIVPRRGVICKASPGTVTIKLADNSNTGMVESYKFDTLKANEAYSIADDPDFTQDYGFDGFIFDGNTSNQSTASLTYGVKMYGRRIQLKRCVIGNVAGVGLWTYCTEQKGGTYTIDKTSIPGCIDELEIMNTFEEAWIYDGPSDIPIGSVVTNECGDKSNNGTTPQTSRHFPGQPVHSVHVTEQTSICAKYMNLNGALFGKLLYVADNNRCIIDTLISAGGWGNIEIGVNVSGGINTLYAQANVRNWGGVIKPFVLNRSNKMVFGKVHIRRGSALPPSDGVVDSGGGVWLQVTAGQASNNGGNLFVADAADIKVNIKAVGIGSTDSSGNVSAVLVTTAKADRLDAEILVNNVSLIWRNEKANLNCFVRIQGDVGTGNALMSGVASSPGISKNSLSELKLSCFDGAGAKKTNSFFGVGAIDLTSTGGKTVAIQHTLWRAPTVEEIQSSIRHSGFTAPGSFSQAYINSFDATQVAFRVEVTTAATGTPVSQVVCRIN